MPLYDYKCSKCGKEAEKFNRMADYKAGPDCCNDTMQRLIKKPPMATEDMKPYKCVATGEYITSRRHRAEVLKKHDLVAVG